MSQPKIVLAGVGKTFRGVGGGDVVAVSEVNMSINAGEFTTIVGPSGCGKSTLLYIIGGFVPRTHGIVTVDGKLVEGPGVERGIVFQEYALFPWLTVLQNILYPLKRRKLSKIVQLKEARRLVEVIGLRGFEDRYPRELSGGMRQRVAIARTLAADPDVLLLDEPFGALDAQTREIMQDELLRVWRQTSKTVCLITHDVTEAIYLSQRIFIMSARPGRIIDEVKVTLDRNQSREVCETSEAFVEQRSAVWLKVRHEALAAAER
jgi:NitT/TauT family transport system ATP-binding protein